MNREIKFRCWKVEDYDWDDKPIWKMIDAENLAFESHEPLVDLLKSDPESEILMQYTGLKDKNGKEIYEGDICKWPSGNISKIVWSDKGCFSAIPINGKTSGRHGIVTHYIEIVGNLYETPELLTH